MIPSSAPRSRNRGFTDMDPLWAYKHWIGKWARLIDINALERYLDEPLDRLQTHVPVSGVMRYAGAFISSDSRYSLVIELRLSNGQHVYRHVQPAMLELDETWPAELCLGAYI